MLAHPPSGAVAKKWLKHFNIEYDIQCTRKGRNGTSYLSQRMKEAWASGKYAKRRPKGQGGKNNDKKLDGSDGDDHIVADGEDANIDMEADAKEVDNDDIVADVEEVDNTGIVEDTEEADNSMADGYDILADFV